MNNVKVMPVMITSGKRKGRWGWCIVQADELIRSTDTYSSEAAALEAGRVWWLTQ